MKEFLYSVGHKWLKQTRPQNLLFYFFSKFQKSAHNFIRPSTNKIFNIHEEVHINLISRLLLRFQTLTWHKFRHNFEITVNPLCSCSIKLIEQCVFSALPSVQCSSNKPCMGDLLNIDSSLPTENDENTLDILLYGNSKFNIKSNHILVCTLKFTKDSHKSDNSLF